MRMIDMMRLCDLFDDDEWLVLVEALASYVDRYKDVDFFSEEVEVAKKLLRKLYGREV